MKVTVLVRKKSRNVHAVAQAAEIASRLQPNFEFLVEPVGWLPRGDSEVNPKNIVQTIKDKVAAKRVIAVISPPLKGKFLEYSSRWRNIVSTADWEIDFAPPPLHVYLLFQFAFAAAAFVADLSPRQIDRRMVHNAFRACIFDSCVGRRKLLSIMIAGYICADCEARLREWGVSDSRLDSIGYLLSHVRDFAVRKPRALPRAVFIGHGRRKDWDRVKHYLETVCKLKVDEFNASPTAGTTTVERLTQMLESACFAILVMTAEDRQEHGAPKARQNVVHEIGLFQGRLGFPRVIILKEEGVDEFSNIRGLTYIPFTKGNIEKAFPEVNRVLFRERIISASNSPSDYEQFENKVVI
jgi:Predicted nucleotide-binding protein containing TIR-like domain